MTRIVDGVERRDRAVAMLLRYGTMCACMLIAAGMLLGAGWPVADAGMLGRDGHALAKAGVALFILLPVTRVALLMGIFLRERDWIHAVLSMLVLAIIAGGVVVGVRG
ncbi:DUF1634 domain-containing protein [Burkholderia sp. Bp9017]|uniref:DUF1634 domain-containing protein n=1 Tax=Burkholderia anthina TaxID=179879 RepID=A0A7T6VJ29_9BURK|nr:MULTISPECIES: DUF1634 domain-containing protein [Burkholderia]MBY4869151.1 DUF1634 domain-containing protein [Burkholderia anthina]QQK04805.1 DUF1634 domain-containing protein [Burkholderia anthina]RQZ31395.1 DUF1634 domain-containing protein [Burkholderia sp. Bp9017]RQZ37527.1 DUF1634 domain-containing protein [Burkholderia sp. Bp9016]